MKTFAAITLLLTVTLFGNAPPSIASDCAVVARRVVPVRHRRAVVAVDTVLIADHHDQHAGHGYGHGVGYQPDNTDLLKIFEAYRKEVEDHKATLKALIAKGGAPEALKTALAPRHPGLGVLNNRCATCHSEATKSKGKGFAFLTDAGDFIDVGENIGRVLGAIDYENGGDMPMGGAQLAAADVLKVERFARSLPTPPAP